MVVRDRLRFLFQEASRLGAALTIDMEQHYYKELTLAIFRSLLEEEEFREKPQASIAIQAYLKDTERDLTQLIRCGLKVANAESACIWLKAPTGTAKSPGLNRRTGPFQSFWKKLKPTPTMSVSANSF